MPQTHPAEWGWKVVKLRFVRNLSPSARNSAKRRSFRRAVRRIRAAQIIWLDESSMADKASMNRLGWAPVGQAAKLAELFRSDSSLYSLLAAVNLDGFVVPACKLVEGGVNDDKFLEWAHRYLLPQLNPYDNRHLKNSVVVLDNAVRMLGAFWRSTCTTSSHQPSHSPPSLPDTHRSFTRAMSSRPCSRRRDVW